MKSIWISVIALFLVLGSCGPVESFTPHMSYEEVIEGVFRSGGVIFSEDEGLNQLAGVDFIKIVTTSGYRGYIHIENISGDGMKFEYALYKDPEKIKNEFDSVCFKSAKELPVRSRA